MPHLSATTARRASLRFLIQAGVLLFTALAARAQTGPCIGCGPRRPVIAAAEIVSVNLLTWSYDHYVQRAYWTEVSPRTWAANIRKGPVWDRNRLSTNQMMHPFHGGVYYNAARSNGFGYWSSIVGAAAGSLMWEYMGETHPASANDLVATTIGGVAIGESMYRLSTVLRSLSGSGRRLGRLAAGLLNPMSLGGDHIPYPGLPENLSLEVSAGLDHALGRHGSRDARFRPVLEAVVRYGQPLSDDVTRPFDVFEFRIRAGRGISSGRTWGPENPVDRLETRGALLTRIVATDRLAVGLYQHLDFFRSPASEFGAQSITAAVFGLQPLSTSLTWSGSMHLGAVLLGSSPSRLAVEPRRTNDYGPGAVVKIDSRLTHRGTDLLRIEARGQWLHDVAGTGADHLVLLAGAEARVPLGRGVSFGAAAELSGHASWSDQARDPHAFSTTARFTLAWKIGR